MKRMLSGIVGLLSLFAVPVLAQQPFTLEQLLNAPFNSDLIAAQNANRLAWSANQQGRRNIWVAEEPSFLARQVTNYTQDDGAELSELRFTAAGNAIVYVRGEGKNAAGEFANPTSNPAGSEQTVWLIAFSGGTPEKIDAGHTPRLSVQGRIAYARDGQIYLARVAGPAGSKEKPKQMAARGNNEPVEWSADGTRLLFVSNRGDHSFVGIYDTETDSVRFMAPSVDRDSDAVWSSDGKHIAFVRQPAVPRDTPEGYFVEPDRIHPWAIWVADANTGEGREIWKSGASMQSSHPYMAEETNAGVLNWAAESNLIFASEEDRWQHLYSLGANGGTPKLLTPGNCEVEQWTFDAERRNILFNSNCGDLDRRHIWSVNANGGETPRELTKDSGVEWNPVYVTGASKFAYVGSDATSPGQIYIAGLDGKSATVISAKLPTAFPADRLVTPQQVIFKSQDGLEIHGQVFAPRDIKAGEKRPALIFLHGGPMRQMLLGWHYMYYYANAYAMNQYLAQRGYVVLAVNYRSGIGYGHAFREAPGRAGRGATEYQDVVAAGEYLQARTDVDAKRIGLWGGSYGGYLTALGLGRNSDLFAAGVDFHGVHDWPTDNWEGKNISPEMNKLARSASPVSVVDTWKSPVLFIHGDDDRTVMFSQTVDLVARLRARGVQVELLVFPDDVHDFLLNGNWLKAYQATSDFFDHQFQTSRK
jgi:dipeptidyl aminopeptidase/acylaminoacyl peptidase